MPQKDSYQILVRNDAIRHEFYHSIQSGTSRMLAYAKIASKYYLSEKSVREIIANRR